ncbi:hypothetical protein D3C72_1772060 [compost metagenome]
MASDAGLVRLDRRVRVQDALAVLFTPANLGGFLAQDLLQLGIRLDAPLLRCVRREGRAPVEPVDRQVLHVRVDHLGERLLDERGVARRHQVRNQRRLAGPDDLRGAIDDLLVKRVAKLVPTEHVGGNQDQEQAHGHEPEDLGLEGLRLKPAQHGLTSQRRANASP